MCIKAVDSPVIRLILVAVVMDAVFGCFRAIKERKFNSGFGIDGAIRKVSMIASLAFLLVIDQILHLNLIGFLPAELRTYLPAEQIGISEFFGLLYLAYEAVSILKNMVLCGLPVKGIQTFLRSFLRKYTSELPDDDELK